MLKLAHDGKVARGLLGILLVVAVLGCSPDFFDLTPEPANLRLTISVQLDGHVARVSGATDLPDGTIIDIYAKNYDVPRGATTYTRVVAGGYSVVIDIGALVSGPAQFTVVMTPSDPEQPQAVRDRFGSNGEKLRGSGTENDDSDSAGRAFRLSVDIDLP
jgi:hypothetical protein